MNSIFIYILLVVAVAAGWFLGRLGSTKPSRGSARNDFYQDYFVGLNYLLNEEPDEAIDTFIKSLEVNSDTIETHLALGALLRRRGKVDKAIQVHQSLLARPSLDQSVIDSTRIQLARDYIASGLLDRAERLLDEILSEDSPAQWKALKLLIRVYQTEKEWEKAIDCSRRLLRHSVYKKDMEIRAAAAHYCCELAENMISQQQYRSARDHIKRAFGFDRKNVRASFILASIEATLGNYKAAISELERIRAITPEFVGETLNPLAECYEQLGSLAEYEKFLKGCLSLESNISVVLALSELIQQRSGDEAAIVFLNEYMEQQPSLAGLLELLKMQIPAADEKVADNLRSLQQMIDVLLKKKFDYQCNHCGYESKNLYWLCPSCKKWDKIKPIVETEPKSN